jgi:hypothetical protein
VDEDSEELLAGRTERKGKGREELEHIGIAVSCSPNAISTCGAFK